MRSMKNSVSLIGNIGKPPEIKEIKPGNKVANFSIATNHNYTNSEGTKVKDTQWHNIVAWGKLAEIIEKFTSKGSEVGIEGKLVYRSYEDKEGVTKYITEILANEVLLLGKNKD